MITETRPLSSEELLAASTMHHVVCDCDPDTALCGIDVTGVQWAEREVDCVICDELDYVPCPRCGY